MQFNSFEQFSILNETMATLRGLGYKAVINGVIKGYGNASCKNEPFASEEYKSLSALLMKGLTHRLC